MPLERQTREMESLGLKGIQNSTLSRMAALTASSLESMAEAILQEDVLTSPLTSPSIKHHGRSRISMKKMAICGSSAIAADHITFLLQPDLQKLLRIN
ncbi:MAG: hypothetical protein ACXVCP_19520 [Bdellovibrio sp.]